MGYFLYQCNKNGHHHGVETDVKVRDNARLLCHFCKQPLELTEVGFKNQTEKEEEKTS
jgi:hypothetical protein